MSWYRSSKMASCIYFDSTELKGEAVSREKMKMYRIVQENSSLV